MGGWSTRELLSILDGLEGLHVIGADVGKSFLPVDILGTRQIANLSALL